MKLQAITTTLALVAFCPGFLTAAETAPDADQLLRQMSSKLAAAKVLRVEAVREIDAALLEGRSLPEKARISAVARRPDKVAAVSKSKHGARHFFADGKQLTLFDEATNLYSVVPMRTGIDGLVDQLDKQYGFTPPLGEFVLSDPYKDLKRHAKTITYLGRGRTTAGFLGLFGVDCHRIGLKGPQADAELWIGVDDHLPRKLTATFHREGNPQVRLAILKWDLASTAADSEFTFTPPKGAQKIEMWTTRKMQSASKR